MGEETKFQAVCEGDEVIKVWGNSNLEEVSNRRYLSLKLKKTKFFYVFWLFRTIWRLWEMISRSESSMLRGGVYRKSGATRTT